MRAFTLIETLVTIVIFALIMGAMAGAVVMLYKVHGYTWQQSQAINEARKGVETMVREIREAREGDDGSYILEKANDYEFIFYSDIDGNRTAERVRYFVEGTDFKKGVIRPVGSLATYPADQEEIFVLTSYVTNIPPIFTYFDKNGEEIMENPARLIDTKMMEVYLIINVNPNRAPQDFELKSAVQLRNLKKD